jgi:hypothetical protein
MEISFFNGMFMKLSMDFYPGETLRLYDGDRLIGMGRYHVNEEGNYIKPTKLL